MHLGFLDSRVVKVPFLSPLCKVKLIRLIVTK